ncbi:MAG: flagellar hook-basal body complex protein FliE [Anaeromyxobacteraceae bacterium]
MSGIRGIGIGIGGLDGLPTQVGPAASPAGGSAATATKGPSSFADALGNALGEVEKLQLQADQEAEKSAMGAGNLHETALALEKADVSMRVMTKVRNKVVEAYQEVMRMSV